MVRFEITDKTKRKARRRRQKKEKRWIPFRISAWVLGVISAVSFTIGIFIIPSANDPRFTVYNTVFAVSLIACVVVEALMFNLTSGWIQTRLNERIWIENGILHHFIQIAFAAGLNARSADSTARVYEYDLSTIRDPKYDPASGRIEFTVDGNLVYYSDCYRNIVEYVRPIQGKRAFFYEYMKPSLYEYLKGEGVKFSMETLNYKLNDPHI